MNNSKSTQAYSYSHGDAINKLGSTLYRHPMHISVRGFQNIKKSGMEKSRITVPFLGGFKQGGKVKKTGIYKLHKGEQVLTKKQKNRIAKAAKTVMKG